MRTSISSLKLPDPSTFAVANGVWQGGILSPILFTVYIDELLQQLANIGVGCH